MYKKISIFAVALLMAAAASAYQVLTPKGTIDVVGVEHDLQKPTYAAVVTEFTPAATATDIITIKGSVNKTIKITKIVVSGHATGSSTEKVYVYKRTAVNTGGTSTTVTAAQYSGDDAAPTATVSKYSVNATGLGAGVLLAAQNVTVTAAATPAVTNTGVEFLFSTRQGRSPIIRLNTNEMIAISWGGNAIPAGLNLYVTVEWTEE